MMKRIMIVVYCGVANENTVVLPLQKGVRWY